MKLDSNGFYRMPLIMGPFWMGEKPKFEYPKIEVVGMQYLTEPDALESLLPECYKPANEPMVTVYFGYYNELDFMAGGGYNVCVMQVGAIFDGKKDHVEGDYILVMFENQTWPILGGREDLGIPKLYCDISQVKTGPGGNIRCEASYWGHFLMRLDLEKPKKQNSIVRIAANKMINSRPWLGYKYFPSLDGPPDADYPTISYNDVKLNELWLSKSGSLIFGSAGENDIGHLSGLMVNLKKLPIRTIKQCLRFRGSAVLRYDLSRRLL
ncbi:MAG: acetoacetate decarboxylase family protein [Bacteroidales bacterium]